jgi:hypothetical protein
VQRYYTITVTLTSARNPVPLVVAVLKPRSPPTTGMPCRSRSCMPSLAFIKSTAYGCMQCRPNTSNGTDRAHDQHKQAMLSLGANCNASLFAQHKQAMLSLGANCNASLFAQHKRHNNTVYSARDDALPFSAQQYKFSRSALCHALGLNR